MAAYTVLNAAATPVMGPFVERLKNPREKFLWRRRMDAWKYGSGADYTLPDEDDIDIL
jgi:hypothetical protein